MKEKMDLETVRKFQMVMLDMAKDLDTLCRQHNITYWITSGTTLGAVRNGKFIPWDDDFDFCFMPDDFYKIRKLIKEELIPNNPHYLLYNDHRPANFGEYLANTNWLFDDFYPVRVDLLKMKSIPNTPEAIQRDRDMINILAFLYNRTNELDVKNKDLLYEALYEGSFWRRRERFMIKFEEYIDSSNQVREDHIYSLDYSYIFTPRLKGYFDYNQIFPVKNIELEGYLFHTPNDTNAYLTQLFGPDYMTPPPKEKQTPYHYSFKKMYFPKMTKWLMWFIYQLKAIKNTFTLIPRIKKLKKVENY